MAVTDKIINKLFVWGSVTANDQDIEDVDSFISTYGNIVGVQAGDLIKAPLHNTMGRNASLIPYCLIEAFKLGPAAVDTTITTPYNDNWYDNLSDNMEFDYAVENTSISNISGYLNSIINQYLKYSQVDLAIRANFWSNARTFTIKDSASHSGTGVTVDGKSDVELPLPTDVQFVTVTTTSDIRLKENVKPYIPEKSILDLEVIEYDLKENGKHSIGCSAQDLKEICPEIVHENCNGYLSIEESKLVYLLLDEVKKLRKELDDLKGR